MKSKWNAGAVLGVLAAVALVVAIPAAIGAKGPQADKPGKGFWKHVAGTPADTKNGKQAAIKAEKLRGYELDRGSLEAELDKAPSEAAAAQPLILSLPAPDGEFQRFALEETSVMEPGLAAKHPEIKTYAGRGIDDASATIRADVSPLGFHASVRSSDGGWYIDPVYERDQSLYASYYLRDAESERDHEFKDPEGAAEALADEIGAAAVAEGPLVAHRTYRLALLSDPSYADYFGAANVTAAKVALMNRVNHIYEEETAITMVLIAANDELNLNTPADMTDPNGPCGTSGCFTAGQATGCTGGTLTRNRIVIGQLVGASAYDVGHIIFGLSGGGVAQLRSVGGNNKAQGCTGLPNPVGDYFAVDYVAHEIGHQFGGNHTFNGNQHNCSGGNRNGANSVEPGSGSSIMAYAGICRHDNLQPHTDPYWSQRSFQEITAWVTTNAPTIDEVQTISLREFDTNGDSFRLSYGGVETVDIVRGTNYTNAAIDAAIEALLPAGSTVSVANWGGGGSASDLGFQVTFNGGPVNDTNVDSLQITAFTGASGYVGETAKGGPQTNQGNVITQTGNHAPTVTTAAAFTIPTRTPFALTGEGSDFDGHPITYMWEQNDRGATGIALVNNVKTSGPLFRVFGTPLLEPPYVETEYAPPGTNVVDDNPTRIFPDLGQIIAGNTNAATGACPEYSGEPWPATVPDELVECFSEFLPTSAWVGFSNDRTMNFRVTVRDHQRPGGGIGSADTRLTIDPLAGPFLVTSQAAEATLDGGTDQTVTWDPAGTDVAPIAAAEVKISLSTDGGWTYEHVLAEATANDGSATVTLPDVSSEAARIKIEAVGNVFFDLSDADLTLRDSHEQLAQLIADSTGVGPGKALADKAREAAAAHAAGDTAAACEDLTGYLALLKAQTGKSVTAAQAAPLKALATQIMDVLGC